MSDISCGITPVGTVVIVLPDQVEKKTSSGIVIATDNESERLQMGQTDGVVIAISPDAFTDLRESKPRCKVGDKIIFAKYAGMMREGNDGLTYRIIHDADIMAILERPLTTESNE